MSENDPAVPPPPGPEGAPAACPVPLAPQQGAFRLGDRGPAQAFLSLIEVVLAGGLALALTAILTIIVLVVHAAAFGDGLDQLVRSFRPGNEMALFGPILPWLMTAQAVAFVLVAWLFLTLGRRVLGTLDGAPVDAIADTFSGAEDAPETRRRPSFDSPAGLRSAALVGGVAGLLATGVALTCGVALQALGLEIEEQAWIRELLSDRSALLMLSPWLVLIVPFSEEAFFRMYAFRRFERSGGLVFALLLSGLLFALPHGNPLGIPIYMSVATVFALAYRRTGSPWTPVVAHAIYNGCVLIIQLVTEPLISP